VELARRQEQPIAQIAKGLGLVHELATDGIDVAVGLPGAEGLQVWLL